MFGAAQSTAAQVVGAVSGAAGGGWTQAQGAAGVVANATGEGLRHAKGAAAAGFDIAMDQKAKFEKLSADMREFLEAWLKQKLQKQIEKVVNKVPGVVKDLVEDPQMPRAVSRGKDRIIDAAWPDVKEEIMWEVAVLLDADAEAPPAEGPGPDCFRAFFRYHIYPADKTIWGKLRDPIWVVFILMSLVPWAGMTPIIFLFIFLIIDKTDEYQLCIFILQFKGTQFISHGILRTLTGFFLYLNCVTVPAKKDGHACDESGPGIAGPINVIMGGWLLQVVLIWVAFLLLPCSQEKGRTTLRGKIAFEHQSSISTKKGGYIQRLMIYDIICFLFCIAVLGYVISTRPGQAHDEWVAKHAFYAVQVIYGLTSLPFFFLTLPGLQAVLLHAVPTAYDSLGRCIQIIGPPRPEKPRSDYTDLLPLDEASRVLDKLKAIAMGTLPVKQAIDEEVAAEKVEEDKQA